MIAQVRPAIFDIFLDYFDFGEPENFESIAVDYPPAPGADLENSLPWAEFGWHDLTELVTRVKPL